MVYTRGTINIGAGASPATFVSGQTSVDGTINYSAGTFNTSGTLSVGGNVLLSGAARNAAGTPTNKKTLEAGTLSMTASGVIDLNDNDAIFRSTPLTTVQARIASARNGGAWNAPGITSTAAKNANPKNTTLGALTGTEYKSALGPAATFNGRAVANTDVLVKYTYYGDSDLNGVVNFDDYARIDSGFNNSRSGWFNGDFDFNGVVNFDDYALIDLAFNTQGGVVLAVRAGDGQPAGPALDRPIIDASMPAALANAGVAPTSIDPNVRSSGELNAVPEPCASAAVHLTLLAASSRRRRRRLIATGSRTNRQMTYGRAPFNSATGGVEEMGSG
jgi:hypothetical protein